MKRQFSFFASVAADWLSVLGEFIPEPIPLTAHRLGRLASNADKCSLVKCPGHNWVSADKEKEG
jgi:hypothetical protein